MSCKNIEEYLLLYFYDELSAEQRAACEAHLAECAHCRGVLEETRRLHDCLGQRSVTDPDPELLAQCRAGLDEALDREETGWRGVLRALLGSGPAWHTSRAVPVLAILVLGFGLGWTLRPRVNPPNLPERRAGVSFADIGRVSSISQVIPDPETGDIHVKVDTERRVTLEGSLDDPRIRQALLLAVQSNENPGVRHETLELLQTQPSNPFVRDVLIYAMQNDPNLGVRLEAMQAVRRAGWSPRVRDAFVQLLRQESNESLRIAAVNALAEHADREALPVLREFAAQDSHPYVRLTCGRVVRQLSEEQ